MNIFGKPNEKATDGLVVVMQQLVNDVFDTVDTTLQKSFEKTEAEANV